MKKFIGCSLLLFIGGCGNTKTVLAFGLLALALLFGHPNNPSNLNGTGVGIVDPIIGPPGPQGLSGANGLACWDLNGNGIADIPAEDVNGDGAVNVYDCRGTNGQNGKDGSSCSVVAVIDGSVTIVCVDNNGSTTSQVISTNSGCKLVNNNDGTYSLSCNDMNVTFNDSQRGIVGGASGSNGTNGVNGSDGINGTNGVNGVDGVNGTNGSSCSVSNNENGTATLFCDNGSEVTITLDQSNQTSFFDLYVDTFYKHAGGENGFTLDKVQVDQPKMTNQSSIAFLAPIPNMYNLNPDAQITLRLFIYKNGGEDCSTDCFSFDIIGKRLQSGTDIQDWGAARTVIPTCFSDGMFTIDIPLSNSCPGGLAYPVVFAGDLLAFELQASCVNGGEYVLIASELFSYSTTQLVNATINCNID